MVDDFEDRYSDDYNPKDYIRKDATRPEPMPTEGGVPVWREVIKDMQARDDFGKSKYNNRLKTHNGRDPLIDAYQEALDLAVYLKQCIMEREEGEMWNED